MTTTDEQNVPRTGDNPAKGFFWLSISYVSDTAFYLFSKVLLNALGRDVFLVWWYFLGLIYHAGYGLLENPVPLAQVMSKNRRLLILYALTDLIATFTMVTAMSIMIPAVVSFINQIQVLFVLFFGFMFLGEKLILREIGAATVIIAGVILISYESPQVPLVGGLLLLTSNVSSAFTYVIVRRIGSDVGILTLARIRTIVLFTVFFIMNIAHYGRIVVPVFPVLALLVVGAFFGPFLNTISIFRTIEHIPVGKAALFRSIQPLFVTIAAAVILGVFPGIRETTGGVVMIAGSALLAYFHAGHMLPSRWPMRGIRD
jgi:drug/metabolite transporter (DMT)-like permease